MGCDGFLWDAMVEPRGTVPPLSAARSGPKYYNDAADDTATTTAPAAPSSPIFKGCSTAFRHQFREPRLSQPHPLPWMGSLTCIAITPRMGDLILQDCSPR
jgi:hypothetical protein